MGHEMPLKLVTPVVRLLVSTVVQHVALGVLLVSLARGFYGVAFLASIVVNMTWWLNIGHRIDLHARGRWVGVAYAVVAATASVLGAWAVRVIP